jgi:23S rRNA (guanosine2251-2'-O)-methyltransferase
MPEYVFGYHAIEETLRRKRSTATLLVSRTNRRIEELRRLAEETGAEVSEVADAELARAYGSGAHKGAALVLRGPPSGKSGGLKERLASLRGEAALALALDHVTDPQNLGAVLRTADQFRADVVVVPSRGSARENQTVVKVSSGASEYVPLAVVPNLPTALELLKKSGFWIYGADMSGDPVDRVGLKGKVCIVMGSEGEGMKRLTRERCDALVRIPASGHVDSFNVSAAAAILMYEVRRQQGFPF